MQISRSLANALAVTFLRSLTISTDLKADVGSSH
jgi:hypothetical protein